MGSSSEVNSPVNLVATGSTQKEIKEFDGAQEELYIEGSSDKMRNSKKGLATGSSGVSKSIHQLYFIITKAAEENDDADNEEGNTQFNKPNGKKEKEKSTSPRGSGK
jgi:hypothetical protein